MSTKTYPNGTVLTIHDDGVSPVEVLKATLEKVYTASDGSTYKEVQVEATLNDITSELDALKTQYESMKARYDLLMVRKNALLTELGKLPAREVAVEEVIIKE